METPTRPSAAWREACGEGEKEKGMERERVRAPSRPTASLRALDRRSPISPARAHALSLSLPHIHTFFCAAASPFVRSAPNAPSASQPASTRAALTSLIGAPLASRRALMAASWAAGEGEADDSGGAEADRARAVRSRLAPARRVVRARREGGMSG